MPIVATTILVDHVQAAQCFCATRQPLSGDVAAHQPMGLSQYGGRSFKIISVT